MVSLDPGHDLIRLLRMPGGQLLEPKLSRSHRPDETAVVARRLLGRWGWQFNWLTRGG